MKTMIKTVFAGWASAWTMVVPCVLLCLWCSGCATISTWEVTGRADIEIDRIECHADNPDIDDGVAVVYGRKTTYVIKGLIDPTSEGEVDRIPVEGTEGKLLVDVSGIGSAEESVIDIVPRGNLFVGALADGLTPVPLRQRGCVLLADERAHVPWVRRSIAVPIHKEPLENEVELWTVKVLDKPYIFYNKTTCSNKIRYKTTESGAGTVVKRILFMPFAVAVDIAMFPIGILFAPFLHM